MIESPDQRSGVTAALTAYLFWGLVPLFWPLLAPADPLEVLAHRILWAWVLCVVFAAVLRVRWWEVLRDRRTAGLLVATSMLIGLNWWTYIWAVNNGHVMDASLGYYINPILSILAGVIFLRERLSVVRWVVVGIVTLAVVILTANYGKLPWVALLLATTFALYGVMKKQIRVNPLSSMTLESLFSAPLALVFLGWWTVAGRETFLAGNITHKLLMAASGVVTIAPLLLFAFAAPRIKLSTMGLLQYTAPTMQFLLALFWFGEEMPPARWIGFIMVWFALILLTVETVIGFRKRRRRTLSA